MRGFIAVTDPGWYERLFALGTRLGPMDANFWRPSPRRVGLATGTPFLFKLRAPANAIAGFGYFANFSVLPDWLAWDTFGEANGVASLDELRARLRRIREGASIEADPQGRIGCSLVAEAVFFARDRWVAAPSDWKPRTQTGTSVDLTTGEALRVWNECLARAPDGVRASAPTLGHQEEPAQARLQRAQLLRAERPPSRAAERADAATVDRGARVASRERVPWLRTRSRACSYVRQSRSWIMVREFIAR